MKTKIFKRLLLFLLLLVGVGEIQATVGIKSLGYKTDFGSTSEPFDKGDIVISNGNIGNVLRVYNTTSRAYFNDVHTLRSNETITISFTAYHGYLNTTCNSYVSICNSDGIVLAGYTYDHTSGQIIDVKIGGATVDGFAAFYGRSYTGSQDAYGISGNGRPYVGGSGTNNPKITMQISENGFVLFNLYLSNRSINQTYWGYVGSAAKTLKYIEITSNCNNEDRTICIDDLDISTNYYSQNYESGTIDWTTSTAGRFTPVILDDGGNKYLSVNQDERNNNGTTLTRPSFNIAEGTDFNMSFDLKISSSTNQQPTSFTIYDQSGSDIIFSLTATGTWSTDWKVNNTTQINLPNTNKGQSYETITDIPWYTVSLTRRGTTTHATIKTKEGNIKYDGDITSSSSGGLGQMEFVTRRYLANFAIDNVEVTPLPTWSESSATIDITDVGATDPNVVADLLPYLKEHRYEISSYSSSNPNVASFWPGNQPLIKGIGTTTITATDSQGNSASYNLTVTGTTVTPVIDGNVLTFSETGIIMNNTENTTKSHTLPKGLIVSYGGTNGSIGETVIVVSSESGSVLKVIDNNGYSRPNVADNGVPYEGIYGGTFVKLQTTADGYMILTGNVSVARSKLYRSDGIAVETEIDESEHTLAASLISGNTYYLYNIRPIGDATDGVIVPMVHSISYVDAYFAKGYDVIPIPTDANHSTTIQTVKGMVNPTYTIDYKGDVGSPTINGTTITGITGGGAIKVTATDGNTSLSYIMTVAYEATEYPGKLWDFYSVEKGLTTTEAMKNVPNPADGSTKTQIGIDGSTWNAEWKNVNVNQRPEWYRYDAVNGDNAFFVPETAGLIFVNGIRNFYLRNDSETFSHIGIRGSGGGTSFTIPLLKKDDVVEIMWRHDASGSGSLFTATNLQDLRGKDVDDVFEITESAERTTRRYVGAYSFIVKEDGNVTFTLQDYGNNDIQSIRIYSGGYRSTMRSINLSGNMIAPTTMLVDNQEDGYEYNYCNQLYSTATGPAMYVLKGYWPEKGDDLECISGWNAAKPANYYLTDNDAYPVTPEEREQLYNLRKNLVGFRMYNEKWESRPGLAAGNSYNNGVIKATSGWGKVTIRMNNYTNDMKYVIGYTPDYTLTIGSAPHQTYPYTWDFTHISAQAERGASTNVFNSIKNKDQYETNWTNTTNGVFSLNTNNTGPLDSQYVPGAVLVTTDRSLSKFRGVSEGMYALDELDGLGFDGKVSIDTDSKTNARRRMSRAGSSRVELLSFTMDKYKVVNTSETINDETIVTDWKNNTGNYQAAGSGWVMFGMDKIEENNVAACGFGYKCDRGVSESSGVYLRPARRLKEGDIITIKAYATSNPTDENKFGLSLFADGSTTALETQFIPNGTKNVETELTYTVTSSNGLEGLDKVCIFRYDKSVYLTEVMITGDPYSEPVKREILCETETTITVPDLNNGKQDWLYVSASEKPTSVTNATEVTEGTDGPDANTDNKVYKYKVTAAGNSLLTFSLGTRIYKIGVTHILKDIHQVGNTGWATEIRKEGEHIDHELIGYFTKNDVNAYTVKYDSYDLNTATVALTPINEDGYVLGRTGIVMKLDNVEGLSDANAGKNVPLFYPSYTRPASSTPVDFPTNNLMYQDNSGIDQDNHNFYETYTVGDINYTKFILTNIHWTYQQSHTLNTDESAVYKEADAAGFYRLHIWSTTGEDDKADKNTMPAHTAYLLVPTSDLPLAVWSQQNGAAARRNTIAIRALWGEDATAIEDVEIDGREGHSSAIEDCEGAWYTLSGMRLQSRPTASGVYIHDGKKVVVSPRVR